MQITVNERIKKIAEKLYGDNISAMAAALCVKRSTLQDIVAGKQSKPGYEIIRQIAEISSPKISLDWLILGVGNMFASEENGALIVQNSTNNNIGSQINDSNVLNRLLSHIEKLGKQIELKDKELERKNKEIDKLNRLLEK